MRSSAFLQSTIRSTPSRLRARVSSTRTREYFDGSLGELVKWDILGSEQLTSERMRVRVQEDWASGSRTVDYQADARGRGAQGGHGQPVN